MNLDLDLALQVARLALMGLMWGLPCPITQQWPRGSQDATCTQPCASLTHACTRLWVRVVCSTEVAPCRTAGVGIHKTGGVREQSQTGLSAASSPQIWNDYKLKWNPSDYDGAEFLRVPAQKIWKPDIVLYNK